MTSAINTIHLVNLVPSIPFVALAIIWSVAWAFDFTDGE